MKKEEKMVKFSKFLILTLTISACFHAQNIFSIDVIPEGQLIRESSQISKRSTVQMYFNANHPPVINVTPGTLTLVQFPSEVRSCTSGTTLITITYGDKTGSSGSSSSSSTSSSSGSSSGASNQAQGESWYSAVFLNADGPSISKIDPNDLLNMPPTDMICQIRISSPDTQHTESYAWKVIGVKIARPEDTYHVVYLLDENGSLNTNGLPSEKELMANGDSYIDVNKLRHLQNNIDESIKQHKSNKHSLKNTEDSQDDENKKSSHLNQRTILTENMNVNSNKDASSVLKEYEFSKSKDNPPSPKM